MLQLHHTLAVAAYCMNLQTVSHDERAAAYASLARCHNKDVNVAVCSVTLGQQLCCEECYQIHQAFVCFESNFLPKHSTTHCFFSN